MAEPKCRCGWVWNEETREAVVKGDYSLITYAIPPAGSQITRRSDQKRLHDCLSRVAPIFSDSVR